MIESNSFVQVNEQTNTRNIVSMLYDSGGQINVRVKVHDGASMAFRLSDLIEILDRCTKIAGLETAPK
jgi:hypothetical protein